MPELADLLERESRRVDPTPGGFDRLARRRDRRERNRRIGAGALALVVAIVAIAALLRANQSQLRPAAPSPSSMAFPGLPPAGAKPSEPVTGTLTLGYDGPDGNGHEMDLSVYADGRMIWQRWSPPVRWYPSSPQPLVIPHGATRFETGYVWQRLTPGGVNRLRSTILASGLFDRNEFFLTKMSYSIDLRTGGRMVRLQADTAGDRTPTPAQLHALHALERLMADPASWLPSSDWADARIHAFVPACYSVAYERGGLDLSKLPAVAAAEIRKHTQHNAAGEMSTDDARTLFRALVGAGYVPSNDSAALIGFRLPPAVTNQLFDPVKFGFLHLSPCLPG